MSNLVQTSLHIPVENSSNIEISDISRMYGTCIKEQYRYTVGQQFFQGYQNNEFHRSKRTN